MILDFSYCSERDAGLRNRQSSDRAEHKNDVGRDLTGRWAVHPSVIFNLPTTNRGRCSGGQAVVMVEATDFRHDVKAAVSQRRRYALASAHDVVRSG